MKIATYGSIFLLGCVLTNAACAGGLEYCRELENKQAPDKEQAMCWKELVTGVQAALPSGKAKKQCSSEQPPAKEAVAEDKPKTRADVANTDVLLEAHESNRIGYTKDNDDVGFMDFTISMQYPLFLQQMQEDGKWLPYIAFTGRFGQYIGTRNSSPVIAKRFNPKLFFRRFLNGSTIKDRDIQKLDYVDFEYAHESNGQSIDSLASFNNHANDLGSVAFAKDHISRGWDYVGVSGQWHPQKDKDFTLGGSAKKYIGGFLQGTIEEYFAWEAPRTITKRNQVNGLQMFAKYDLSCMSSSWLGIASFKLDTGSNNPLRYNTYTVEAEITPFRNFLGAPMVIVYRNGYNSDIAQYFVRGSSIGLGLKFDSFR